MGLKKVLLLDSSNALFGDDLEMLDREVLKVYNAKTGDEAIAIHRKNKMDVIILEHDLPDMTGTDFCREIRADNAMKGVSLIVGLKNPADMIIKRFKEAGANTCVRCPVDKGELLPALAKFLCIPLRQTLRIIVKIKMDAKLGSDFFIANMSNLSATGMLIECDQDLAIGKPVEASFYLPTSEGFYRITAKAVIMRSDAGEVKDQRRYGMEFREFTEGDPWMIDKYVTDKVSGN